MAGRILIADSVSTNRISLAAILRHARYDFLTAEDSAEALALFRATPADLVLLADDLPGSPLDKTLGSLAASNPADGVPVLVFTSDPSPEARLAALSAGADDVVLRPVDEQALLARIRALLRARETDRAMARREVTVEELGFAETSPAFEAAPRIACAGISEDDPWTAPLTRAFGRSVIATDLERVLDECDRDHPAEVVVIRADGAPGEGLRMLSELRSRTGTRHAAILVVVPPRDTQTAAMALDLGASDIVPDNASAEELAFRIRTQLRRKRKADRLRSSVDDGLRLAMEDPLTGLYNRRYAMANLARLHKSSDRTGRDFGLLLVDIDRFKAINDTRGHAVGDVVLTEVARRLRDNLRGIDMVARIGGEEFLVAMPDIAPVGALAAAQRLCRVVGSDPVRLDNGQPPVAVTISIGLAMYDKSSREPVAALIERADQALYRAKTDGRNQVTVSRTAA